MTAGWSAFIPQMGYLEGEGEIQLLPAPGRPDDGAGPGQLRELDRPRSHPAPGRIYENGVALPDARGVVLHAVGGLALH